MKHTKTGTITVTASAVYECTGSASAAVAVSPPVRLGPTQRQPSLGRQPSLRVIPKTTLEARQFSKEFEQWVTALTINSPESLTFRWATTQAGATGATWRVSDAPSPRRMGEAPKVLAQGTLKDAPPKGAVFQINFAPFIPKWPPVSPGFYNYWVSLTPIGSTGEPIGPASPAVKVTYLAPAAPVQFGCFSNADCGVGYVCNQNTTQCGPLSYVCDGHILRGSDGSQVDCTPYICQASQCLQTCTSVDQCVFPPYVCDGRGLCVWQSK